VWFDPASSAPKLKSKAKDAADNLRYGEVSRT
jgi:hypothetical protein